MVERTGSLALPIDFVISGVPVSVQSRATAAMDWWQLAVAAAARAARPRRRGGDDASIGRLAVTLVYFYVTPPLDTDKLLPAARSVS